jgi:hypothetical protein
VASEQGLASVYEDQRIESLRQIEQSDIPDIVKLRPAIEHALRDDRRPVSASDSPPSDDLRHFLDFAKTTFAWLRHRLLLQLTELLFERGPYVTAIGSHLRIARSIRHCFKIALQISDDSSTASSGVPSICLELPELLRTFDETVVGTLERAAREAETGGQLAGFAMGELETRAHGHLIDTFVHVSNLLGRLRECIECLDASRFERGTTKHPPRVLLYKRDELFFAHDLDADLIAYDKSGYEEAILMLQELQEAARLPLDVDGAKYAVPPLAVLSAAAGG